VQVTRRVSGLKIDENDKLSLQSTEERMAGPISIARRLQRIAWLIHRNDLAAVIVHLNDLYLIEDRPDEIPGLARIATLIKCIRRLLIKRLGEDRTLVVHSGDFLSPSFMSNATKLKFRGEQMVELLNLCGVNFVTLGNHEFDFGLDTLVQRLKEFDAKVVLTNLVPPPDFPSCEAIALWPKSDPFIGILGLAGKDTVNAAKPFGFTENDTEKALSAAFAKIKSDTRLGAVVALTHMNRHEDKDLQRMIPANWDKSGGVYVLGGHDHHINWIEHFGPADLSKNPINGKSVAVFALRKSAIASLSKKSIPPKTHEIDIMTLSREQRLNPPPDNVLPTFEDAVASSTEQWRKIAPRAMRADFSQAFERLICETATYGFNERLFREYAYWGEGAHHVIEAAGSSAHAERSRKDVIRLTGKDDLIPNLLPDRMASEAVGRWIKKRDEKMGSDGNRLVRDFSDFATQMDGSEASLRSKSTDFGNFVVDAVRAATQSDIALINSGSFRNDDSLPARISERDLWETFFYDDAGAISVVQLTVDEVTSVYAHSSSRIKSGAFLQVSEPIESISKRKGMIRVAIATYLLTHDVDGYKEQIAIRRGCPTDELAKCLPGIGQSTKTLVELILEGANQVAYCNEDRTGNDIITIAGEGEAEHANAFIALVNQYLESCDRAEIHKNDRRLLIMEDSLSSLPADVTSSRSRIHEYVRDLILKRAKQESVTDLDRPSFESVQEGIKWVSEEFSNMLAASEEGPKRQMLYDLYLSAALDVVAYSTLKAHFREENCWRSDSAG
jgi:2',3'-cyclic-nucleotide 2'-phosphodiesterase (5'-nucleotidase family)